MQVSTNQENDSFTVVEVWSTEKGRLEGWVDNSRLDWRTPTKETLIKAPVEESGKSDQSESGQLAPATAGPGQPDQAQEETGSMENPAPEVSGDNNEPMVEALPAPKEAVSTPVAAPVVEAPPAPKKPTVPTGDGSKPAPSIFDSF